MESEIQVRIQRVQQRIADAAQRVGRHPRTVTLLGASKMVQPEWIEAATLHGIAHVGENRIQEAVAKFQRLPSLRDSATWHMIGHLQGNKVRQALELVDVIQTVDTARLAQRIDSTAGEMGRSVPIYIEVNLGLEESKTGVAPGQLLELADAIAPCQHLKLEGLMAVPPFTEDPEGARPYFKMLRDLRDTLNQRQLFDYEVGGLSMGMSHDFEVAIEEGATMVRLGSSIWGARPS